MPAGHVNVDVLVPFFDSSWRTSTSASKSSALVQALERSEQDEDEWEQRRCQGLRRRRVKHRHDRFDPTEVNEKKPSPPPHRIPWPGHDYFVYWPIC